MYQSLPAFKLEIETALAAYRVDPSGVMAERVLGALDAALYAFDDGKPYCREVACTILNGMPPGFTLYEYANRKLTEM